MQPAPVYYLLPRDKSGTLTPLDLSDAVGTYWNLQFAKDTADTLREKTGLHYSVVAVETVWATTTLDELMGERA